MALIASLLGVGAVLGRVGCALAQVAESVFLVIGVNVRLDGSDTGPLRFFF